MTNNFNPSNDNSKYFWSKLIFLFGTILGLGIEHGLYSYPRIVKSPTAEVRSFTQEDYELLTIGMSLTEVRSILGKGKELNRSATSATYMWANLDGSKIMLFFEGDKLKKKEELRLKL